MGIVTEMIQILVAGLSGIASGIGSGLTALVQGIFVTGDGSSGSPYALTTFGVVTLAFAGVALAISLSTRIVLWITSLGRM